MQHLNRDQKYKTVKQAIKKDNPEIAESMDRMADSMSASLEIISSQLGEGAAANPSYVIPMAVEIFKDSQEEREANKSKHQENSSEENSSEGK